MKELHNADMERTVLVTLMFEIDPAALDEMLDTVYADMFFVHAHRAIYDAITSLHAEGSPVDETMIVSRLSKAGALDEKALMEVMAATPTAGLASYTEELAELERKRRLLTMAMNIRKEVYDDGATADDITAVIDRTLEEMDNRRGAADPITMEEAIRRYDEMTEPPKIQTGIRKFDEMLCGGFEQAQMIHVGGEKNVGKTTLTKQILYNVSAGFGSLFFSFEMPGWKMAKMTKRMRGPANLRNYRIVDTQMLPSRDVSDVARMIRREWRRHNIRFVLIDSKMKLQHRAFRGRNEADKRGDIDAVLNAVVQETGIVLMLITQLSKSDIDAGTMSSYGSGLSDYEADMQIMLYHSKEAAGAVEAKVTKERQEVLQKPCRLWLNRDEMKFEDMHVVVEEYRQDPDEAAAAASDKIEIEVLA